jgi:ribosomal protein S27AE
MNRPLPKSWAERLRERVTSAAPKKGLTVVPKGPRPSGPFPAGTLWYLPLAQAEMAAEMEGLLDPKHCADCGGRVIAATGELVKGLYCGRCWGMRQDANEPPSAA